VVGITQHSEHIQLQENDLYRIKNSSRQTNSERRVIKQEVIR
jgi:hypothetical protein